MRKKKLILIVAIISILFFAFSIFFIGEKSNHECSGIDCEICEEIAICEKGLKEFGLGAITIAIVVLNSFPKLSNEKIKVNSTYKKDSLISLKIELLN